MGEEGEFKLPGLERFRIRVLSFTLKTQKRGPVDNCHRVKGQKKNELQIKGKQELGSRACSNQFQGEAREKKTRSQEDYFGRIATPQKNEEERGRYSEQRKKLYG